MPNPQSGISKSSLLLLGGLTALLASSSTRAKLGALVQGTLGSAQNLLGDTVAPAAQHAVHTVAVRAGELTEEARKVAAQAQDHLPGLIDSVREQAGQRSQQLLDSTADLRGDLAERAGAAAAVAAKTAASVQDSLSSTVASTVSSVQDTVQDRLSDAQHEAGKRRKVLVSEAKALRGDLARTVSRKVKQGKKVQRKVQKQAKREAKAGWLGFLDTAQDQTQNRVEDARKVAQKKLEHAGKDARKQVKQVKQIGKQVQRNWPSFADEAQDRVQSVSAEARRRAQAQFGSLDKRSRKQVKGYEKKIARLEKELSRTADRQLKKAGLGRKRRGVGGLLPVALLVGGGVALARVPAARQGILDLVGAVSPEAAQWLHDAGRTVRNAIGTAWLERMEDANHAPAPQAPSPKPDQATGSAAGASVAPDAPAATPAPVDPAPADLGSTQDAAKETQADTKKN